APIVARTVKAQDLTVEAKVLRVAARAEHRLHGDRADEPPVPIAEVAGPVHEPIARSPRGLQAARDGDRLPLELLLLQRLDLDQGDRVGRGQVAGIEEIRIYGRAHAGITPLRLDRGRCGGRA